MAIGTSVKGFGLATKTSNTKLILNGGQRVTFARPDGYFAFHNVPAGTHLIEVSSIGYFFSPVRVDISVRNLGYIQAALTETRRVLNELVLEPLKEEQYYEVDPEEMKQAQEQMRNNPVSLSGLLARVQG
ncbi:ER membrane protein complex subunit 7-like protein [Zea mays]|uniref:ER membrane protein complex subunit 7-like protein n=1 Tax=Zea mays TaxID=4577 RepID=A0A1D6N921_MAIZE|nr:ER membrane protein complex subunit 7-like protein [Zea mays]